MPVKKARKPAPEASLLSHLLGGTAFAFLILLFTAAAALWMGYVYLAEQLPVIDSLHSYAPSLPSQIFADDGTLIAELGAERRRLMQEDEIPEVVKKAFLAAEDHRFLEHRGVDFHGVLGALWHDLRHPDDLRGASTITMQVARTFFLSRERTLTRKIQEAILALRIERELTKLQILYLYLNQVEMGRGCFGIGEAAFYYFGKPVSELTLAEAAMLAGILPAPSRYNPVTSFARAKERQRIVLFKKMWREAGMISREEAEAAAAEPLKIVAQRGPRGEAAPYFVEHVRRLLLDRYGEEMVYRGGLKVFTTVNLRADAAARRALRNGVLGPGGLDRVIGFRGPLSSEPLSGETAERFLAAQEDKLKRKWAERARSEALRQGSEEAGESRQSFYLRTPEPAPLEAGEIYEAVVRTVTDSPPQVHVSIGHSQGVLRAPDMAWAGKYDDDAAPPRRISRPSDILSPGHRILVRVIDRENGAADEAVYRVALEQEPVIEGGLIALEVRTGHVKALCGGLDFQRSQFIRPLQATRQPGSAFKPIVFAAALDDPQGRFTPATILLDTAIVFDRSTTNPVCPAEVAIWENYKPRNYSHTFTGPHTLRNALAYSINTIAARLAWNLCLPRVIDYAHNLGIRSRLDLLPCVALGCSEVTLAELTTAYNVFASGGYLVEPRYITRVYDRNGYLLEYEPEDGKDGMERDPGRRAVRNPGDDEVFAGEGEEEVAGRAESSRPSSLALPRPRRPAELGQPTVEEYLAHLRSSDHEWLAPVSEPPAGERVISAQTAYLMNNLLTSVIKYGTASAANRLARPLAGKTGTTNNYKDALFIGYSPELIAGVWVGAEEYRWSLGKEMTGGKAALPIWMEFMAELLKDRPRVDFPVPDGIEWVNIDPNTGLRASRCSARIVSEVFKKGTAPTESTLCQGNDYYFIYNYERDLNE